MTETETMSTKDIMQLAGVSKDTVIKTIKSFFPERVKNGVLTHIDKNEAMIVVDALRKKGFVLPTQNAKVPAENKKVHPQNELSQNETLHSGLTEKDILLISSIVSMTVAKTIEVLDRRMQKIETVVEERKAILPPPEMPKKKQLAKIINDYCSKSGISYQEAYNRLYSDVYYRLGLNLKLQASNKGCKAIDVAEQLGKIDDLIAIASTF